MADIVYPGATSGPALNSGAMPANSDLVIYKGDYVEFFVTMKDDAGVSIVLTGQIPKAQLKTSYTDSAPINFDCSIAGPTLVRVYLSSAQSSALTAGDYIWDMQLTNASGQTKTYLAGDVTVYNEVTTV